MRNAIMSKIPYFFETPLPKYFRESGWFSNPNTILFVTWAFSKCSIQSHRAVMNGKEITLAPYEFIAGRLTSPKECFLSEEAWRHQLNTQLKAGLLKKTPNSTPNRFTCYVWVTERFSDVNPQLNPQSAPNQPPTEPPQSRRKNERIKEDHQPYPSSKILQLGDDLDGLTDDFSLDQKKEGDQKIEVVAGVFLTREELDQCIAIKGSHQAVEYAITHILKSPGRKCKIYNWVNTLSKWHIKEDATPRLRENERFAKQLEDKYSKRNGWRCEIYTDRKKDQKGILFYSTASVGNPETFFISFIDVDFEQKVRKVLKDKNIGE
jgi:hypothetical protein